ncbi:MAG: ORC1-type DNA replication protein [Nanoarchaeota archaeon]|nr:ORC1-type DNA replication protein [Nanoarchaeota archaeon]
MGDEVTDYFENYLEKDSLFRNKAVLSSNHLPEEIKHRDDQLNQVAKIIAPCLRNEKPSNLFVYGKTGTGKTLAIKHTKDKLEKIAETKKIPLKIIYLNCKLKRIADTEYRLVAELARHFGKNIPATGLPTDEVYNIFFKALESDTKQIILVILDEIDQLIRKAGDEIIYNLTRINSELKNTQISIIGISNDLLFVNNLDPRVRSSLSEEELIFPPYNALQIQDILRARARDAFKEGCIDAGVIEKCSAFAAREHGDARRALELLRVSGELAERNNQERIRIEHLDEAEEKIERDRIIDAVKSQPKQFQAVLYSLLSIMQNKKEPLFTGEIYEQYKQFCPDAGLRPLTQRRVSDIIAELDMLGVINAKVISKGRFGRTREISTPLSSSIKVKMMKLTKDELSA